MKTKRRHHLITLILILGLILFSSCKNSSTENLDNENDSIQKIEDSLNLVNADSLDSIMEVDTMAVKKVFKDADTQEAHQAIVKKYGEQWDLCRCIEKSDSVNKALMVADDKDFDAVMERSDYIDKKCKDMLIHPNETPEERYEYQKKVNKCLEQAKK